MREYYGLYTKENTLPHSAPLHSDSAPACADRKLREHESLLSEDTELIIRLYFNYCDVTRHKSAPPT